MSIDKNVSKILSEFNSYYSDFTIPVNYEFSEVKEFEDLFENPFFNSMMSNTPSILLVFNFVKTVYEYLSPNLKNILGYEPNEMVGLSGAEFALNCFGPEQLPIIIEQNSNIMKYYQEYATQNKASNLKLTHVFKLRKANGDYIWTMMQTMALDVLENGFPWRSFSFITDISDVKDDHVMYFSISERITDGLGYKVIHASTYPNYTTNKTLTDRELAVLNLLRKGLKSREIADKLNISDETVKTHRKNILKKTGKNNFIQLLK